tara:strand:+ start:456 stop:623 length:168 start_codon:yes stop_codon:yes gene_type:complete
MSGWSRRISEIKWQAASVATTRGGKAFELFMFSLQKVASPTSEERERKAGLAELN